MNEPEWGDAAELPPVDPNLWVRLDDLSVIPLPANGSGPHTPDPDVSGGWLPINLGALPDVPPIAPTLGKTGLCYPGKRHVFSGPQESAKTLAAYAIGLDIVRGGARIVVIDFEMGAYDARNRLRELGATPEDFARILYTEPHAPADNATMGKLAQHKPALVIIDAAAGAYDLQGLDDNKRQDVERFTRLYVREFWRLQIATIVLDHVVKNADTRGVYAIGSERKTGGADVHLGFETITPISRGGHGSYKIITHKDRGGYLQRGHLANLTLQSDPATHALTWEVTPVTKPEPGEVWLPTALMTKVSVYLSGLAEPAPRKQVVEEVIGRKDVIRRALDHLIRLGYATETEGARGAKLVEHARLFHEHDLPKPTETTTHEYDLNDVAPRSPEGNGATSRDRSPHVAPPPEGGSRGYVTHREGQVPNTHVAPGHVDSDIPF